MEIQLYSNQEKDWNDYVMRKDSSTFFHQIQYKRVIEETFGHKAYYLFAWEGRNIVGILPCFLIKSFLFGRCLVSLPFCDYGGIVADNSEVESMLMKSAIEIGQDENAVLMELRHRYPIALELSSSLGKVNLRLPLGTAEEAWSGFKAKVRNQVRKAQKSGLNFQVAGIEGLTQFYRVFSKNMRDLGTPVYSISLFDSFLTYFPDSSELLLVKSEDETIGGAVAVYFRNAMEVPWASSLRDYFRYCPNNLLYWGAISRGCERELAYFDFGRSSKGSGNYVFKKQWGAYDEQLFYNCVPVRKTRDSFGPLSNTSGLRYRIGVSVWKRLPLRLANNIGPLISRHIP